MHNKFFLTLLILLTSVLHLINYLSIPLKLNSCLLAQVSSVLKLLLTSFLSLAVLFCHHPLPKILAWSLILIFHFLNTFLLSVDVLITLFVSFVKFALPLAIIQLSFLLILSYLPILITAMLSISTFLNIPCTDFNLCKIPLLAQSCILLNVAIISHLNYANFTGSLFNNEFTSKSVS